jgi:hypothetical protein
MKRREAFTLFELILAIALAAVLLTLIGTAINLYLVRVDAGRARVEEAQLARNVLTMIANDVRATTIYQPQDTSAIAELMAKTATYDVDDIDKARATTGGNTGASGTTGTGGGGSAGGATGFGRSPSAGQSAGESGSDENDQTMPLGLNGGPSELFVDATHLPRQEELFSTTTGYTNAPSPASDAGKSASASSSASALSGVVPAADLKTVHYYVRPGDAVEAGSASATSLDPAAQLRIGGLVRQETPRAERVFAEQNGGSDVLQSGETLIAPEVMHIEFHYFDGSEAFDTWDMKERKSLPVAIEVCVWLRSPNAANEAIGTYTAADLVNKAHEYKQVVFLPMAELMNSQQSNGMGQSSTETSSTGSSATGQSSLSSGADFGQTN